MTDIEKQIEWKIDDAADKTYQGFRGNTPAEYDNGFYDRLSEQSRAIMDHCKEAGITDFETTEEKE